MSTEGFDFLPRGCPCDDPAADAFRVRVQQQAEGWAVVHSGKHWDGCSWSTSPANPMEFSTAVAAARQAANRLTLDGRTYTEHRRYRP